LLLDEFAAARPATNGERRAVMYPRYITPEPSLSQVAYERIKRMIVRLELAPGSVVREDDLVARTGVGRTPIREAVQRLERDQLLAVIPRRGLLVTSIDVGELPMLYESRAMLEPYVHRLAAARGTEAQWRPMEQALAHVERRGTRATWELLMDTDRLCHTQVWQAADNRFLTDTLDMLYTQSERLWHLYLRDAYDLHDALDEHRVILAALRSGDGDKVARLAEDHVRTFEAQTRSVITSRLVSPLAAGS
jgi:DNA-binding GntR family transcriptional regulator